MQDEKPAPAVKPIGSVEARERAEAAARAGNWNESQAWSLLGLLALERRNASGGRRGN